MGKQTARPAPATAAPARKFPLWIVPTVLVGGLGVSLIRGRLEPRLRPAPRRGRRAAGGGRGPRRHLRRWAATTPPTRAPPTSDPVHTVTVAPFEMDATEVTVAQYAAFVKAAGYVTVAESVPDPAEVPERGPVLHAEARSPRCSMPTDAAAATARGKRRTRRGGATPTGASWRHPEGPQSSSEGQDELPRGAYRVGRCRRVCEVGRQAVADGSRVGVGRARRAGRQAVHLGRCQERRRRQVVRERLPGHLPGERHRRRRLRRPRAGQELPAQRLRPVRHERQRLGVVRRLVRPRLLRGVAEGQPAWAGGRGARRPGGSASAAGPARRLVPVRRQLLPPLCAQRPRQEARPTVAPTTPAFGA